MIIIPNIASSGFSDTVVNIVVPTYLQTMSLMDMSPDGTTIYATQDGYSTVNIFNVGATDSYTAYRAGNGSYGISGICSSSNKFFIGNFRGVAAFLASSPYNSAGTFDQGQSPQYGQPAVNAAGTQLWAPLQTNAYISSFSLSATDLSQTNYFRYPLPAGAAKYLISTPDPSNPGETILYCSYREYSNSGIAKITTVDSTVTSLQYPGIAQYGNAISLNDAKNRLYAVSNEGGMIRVINPLTLTQIASTTNTAIGLSTGINYALPNRFGDKLYVSHGNGITVLDSTSLSVLKTINKNHLGANLTSVWEMRFNLLGTKLYATTTGGILVIA